MQEARAASALNHPNIVTLHDIASESEMEYLVMDYVAGKSLDKRITPKGLPVPEALTRLRLRPRRCIDFSQMARDVGDARKRLCGLASLREISPTCCWRCV